jgi:hypothetical protein
MKYPPKQYVRVLAIVLPLLLVGIYFAWHAAQTDPKRVFSDMLRNNLTTAAVTKSVQSSGSDGNATLQRINLQLGAQNVSRWLTTVTSDGSAVTTDSIGTVTADYVSYGDISDKSGKTDYQGLVGIWAKTASRTGSDQQPSLLSASLLDMTLAPVPPIGNIVKPTRDDMLAYIDEQNVFTADFSKVKTVTINGRKAYEYPVSVKLAPYVRLMQAFAHAYGLSELDELSATQYQNAQPVNVKLAVDVLSHRMLRLTLPANGFSETFNDYGIVHTVSLPTKTVTGAQLQQRFESSQ